MSEQLKGSTFEELYLQQRKKSQMLLVAVIVLAVLAAGSLAWGFSKDGSGNQSGMPGNSQGQGFNGQSGPGGMGGPGGRMGMDIKSFFNDDGSVNTDQIEQMTSRMPSGGGRGGFDITDMIKQQADQAVEDGDITQGQADALIKAFESESSTNES